MESEESKRGNGRRVLVTGATGRLGQVLVPLLLEHGFNVRVMSRNVEKAKQSLTAGTLSQCEVVEGDLTKASSLLHVTQNVDILMLTGGAYSWLGMGTHNTPFTVDYQGTKDIIDSCSANGCRLQQIVFVSASNITRKWGSLMYDISMGNYAKWKREAESLIRQSGIPYTIVRPGALTEGRHCLNGVLLAQGDKIGLSPISRRDLALVCVHSLLEPGAQNKTFELRQRSAKEVASAPGNWKDAFSLLKNDKTPNI
eukprot:GILK01004949.1.p1 GENE.GILK01004949.1~~GILK01004949.1.p1  ORF type:complete len:267 (+),score=13.66 GILK01004949.1:39-803(+)